MARTMFFTEIDAGRRKYFFEAKKRAGLIYIKITELREKNGLFKPRAKIVVRANAFADFKQAFESVVRELHKTLEKPRDFPTHAQLEELRKIYPRAYEPWTTQEDRQLNTEFKESVVLNEIASAHGRKRGAIRSRLKKLGLLEIN